MPPERSLEQRMTALERANEVRSRRAVLKRQLANGETHFTDLVFEVPWWAETMKVSTALMACPGVGREKAKKILGLIPPSKTLGGLTHRQRKELVARLPMRAQ